MYNNSENIPVVNDPLGLFPNEVGKKPFLKWAGGKTQLIPELSKYIPPSFNKYIEPFIGGGSFFFYLNPTEAIISDSNEELITTYKAVRDHVEEVIDILEEYQRQGIGGKLMHAYISHMRKLGVKGIHLGTSEKNKKGVPFYKKMGFKIVRVDRGNLWPDEPDIRSITFAKKL